MSSLSDHIVPAISALLPTIWENVGQTVSENIAKPVTFDSPLCIAGRNAEIVSQLSGQYLAIQFAIATVPDSVQVVLIPPDALLELTALVSDSRPSVADENIVPEVRPIAEAIVQGLCLALGGLISATVVASGLSIRFQNIELPSNLLHAGEFVRVQIAARTDSFSGSMLWLFDSDTASLLLQTKSEDDVSPFAQTTELPSATGSRAGIGFPEQEASSFDVLLDVPLEISVELGRVKMLIKEVLDLGTGSIIEVDKAAGEPVDVMVNGRLVAKGEVVVIEDNFGVRITEILNPNDRFRMEHAA